MAEQNTEAPKAPERKSQYEQGEESEDQDKRRREVKEHFEDESFLLDEEKYEALRPTLIPFSEKYERQEAGEKVPFKPGERVSAKFKVMLVYDEKGRIDGTKVQLLVDAYDVRHSDQFTINVSPDEYQQLTQNPGVVYDGIVEVTDKGEYDTSNMFEYPAKILGLQNNMLKNPDRKTIRDSEDGARALVEGEIVRMHPIVVQGRYAKTSKFRLTVQTNDGTREVLIDADVEYGYSPGLENADGKVPEIGDKVQVTACARNGRLEAPWCRSCYLLRPNRGRQERYDQLRSKVAQEMEEVTDALQRNAYRSFRERYATLVQQELTREEEDKIEQLYDQMPAEERPIIISSRDRYVVQPINERFGVDVDSMTMEQFREFVLQQAKTPFAKGNKGENEADESYIFRLMRYVNMPPEQQDDILSQSVLTRLHYFKDNADKGREYDSSRDYDDSCYLSAAVRNLNNPVNPYKAQTLMKAMAECIKHSQNEAFPDKIFDCCSTINSAARDARKQGNRRALEYFQENLPFLRYWAGKLKRNPKERYALQELTQAIRALEEK